MKRIVALFLLTMTTIGVMAATDFSEDFSTLKSGTTYSSLTDVSLPSGIWKMSGVRVNVSNSIASINYNTGNGYIITPVIDDPGKIGVEYRSGGSNKVIAISYSIDGGSSWTQLDELKIASSSSSFATYSKKTGLDGQTGVMFRLASTSSNVYVGKFTAKSINVEPDTDDPTYITEGVWVPTKPFPEPVKTIYIAPDGDDQSGDGTIEKPWQNLQKAINAAQPGTHIICRGGTYRMRVQSDGKFTVRIKESGTPEQPIVIRCQDGERPVFDFRDGLTNERVGERGLTITGNHWWLFGLHITHAADNGIKLEGSHCRIERCEFSYNLDTGLQLGFGHKFSDTFPGLSKNDGTYCAYNDVIDCDSHHNCDYDANYGSDADGFACKMHNGKGNRFIRCRAWHNSDDSWDLYETDYDVMIAECWAWAAGIASDHTWVKDFIIKSGNMSFSGNGNGIKLGGNGTGGSSQGIHYVFNSIAFGHNQGSSVKGFDCNSHKGGHVLVGCLGFDNSYDYMFESGGSDANTLYYNNVCLGKQEICVGYDDYNAISAPMSKNGWTRHLVTGVSADDYLSLDEDDALRPRDIYGGLPRKFGRLASDSKMIDKGDASLEESVPVWQQLVIDFPFLARNITGTARDLGPYERQGSTPSAISTVSIYEKSAVKKLLINGRFIIDKDGQRYNAIGTRLY